MRIFAYLYLLGISAISLANSNKILVLGDSISEGYGVSPKDAYPAILESELKKEGQSVVVVNAGSSGSTTASGLSRLKWHLKSKPALLILALGANDGLRGIKLDTTKENLGKTIELAQKNQIKVILAGMKLPYNYGKEYREGFESLYKSLVKKYKLVSIPFLLKGVGGEKKMNISDGIHPNEKGHILIAKNIKSIIVKALKENNDQSQKPLQNIRPGKPKG